MTTREMTTTNTGQRLPTPAPGGVRDLLQSTAVMQRFERVLGDPNKAALFVGSLATLVYASDALKQCEPNSIIAAAIEAAAYDVPIGPTLGYAHLIPYNGKARFQPGWKLYVQLAHRSGQYQRIHVGELYEGQVRGTDPFTGELLRGERTGDAVAGYIAYFKLLTGFEKHVYMTVAELDAHGKRYSKTYARSDSKWKTDFDAMARKTVLKALLSKWGPLSIQMQKVLLADVPPDETPTNGNGHGTEADKAALYGTDDDSDTGAMPGVPPEPATPPPAAATVESQPPMPEPPPDPDYTDPAFMAQQIEAEQQAAEPARRRRR
jgi:recombination protein RecT